MTSTREQIASMDDYQVVRFFRYWSGNLCDGAVTEYDVIVDGVPTEVAAGQELAAISELTVAQSSAAISPADSVRLARAMLEPLADTPEVGPTIATALASFHDEKLAVDVILAIGLVTSALLIVSTIEFEGKIGSWTFHKGKVDPEMLKTIMEFAGGLLGPYLGKRE